MTFLPRKRVRPKMGLREPTQIRSAGHLKWVRGFCCVIGDDHSCDGNIHAHHLQSYRAIEGGMGLKVGDDKVVPLCSEAHLLIHVIGQDAFEKQFEVELEPIAQNFWKQSPHRLKWEQKQRGKA